MNKEQRIRVVIFAANEQKIEKRNSLFREEE